MVFHSTLRVTAIILKRRVTGESDRILTAFTRQQGKLRMLAKGIRKVGSRRSAFLEPLRVSVLILHEGSGIPIVTQADSLPGMPIADDRSMLVVAGKYYIAELLDTLIPDNEPHEQLFDRTVAVLQGLTTAESDDTVIDILIGYTREILLALGFIAPSVTYQSLSEAVAAVEAISERKIKSRRILAYSR